MNKNNDCLFCKIVSGTVPAEKIHEDESTFVFLDLSPVSKGHMLFVPKDHANDFNSGNKESAISLIETIHKIAPSVLNSLGATGYNLGMNHGVDAGQEVFHTHIHFMPRYAGEERTFIKTKPSQEELKSIADIIRIEI